MTRKQVLLFNYEGHQYDPKYETPWSDTWVRFKIRRKPIRLGPTLISKADLDRDRELFEGQTVDGIDLWDRPNLPEGDWDFCLPFGEEGYGNTPVIGVNKPGITKGVIEAAVEWYIRLKYGVTSQMHFHWRANKDRLFVNPL